MKEPSIDNEALYRNLVEAFLDEGFHLFEPIRDETGKVTDFITLKVNSAYERQSGLKAEQVVGKRISKFLPNIEPIWFSVVQQVLEKGKAQHIVDYNVSTHRWYDQYIFKYKDGQIGALFKDITKQKQTENELRENERLYKTIFDSSEDGFMLVEILYDSNGKPIDQKYLKINQAFCKQTGIQEEDIIGKTMRQVLPNVEQSWFEIPDKVLKTGKPIHTENYNQDTNRYYDLYCFPFSEKTVGSLFRDITQRKNLEKQLQEKERLAGIGQTAGMVGHDIRNPLQAIAGDIYLLKDFLTQMPENIPTKAEVVESLDSIEKNVSYINKIVADLQDYARPIKFELSEFNLCDLVKTVLAPIEIPASITVSIDLDSTCSIRSDPTLLRRIINNLIVNALQAMPDGGRLCVNGYRRGERFLLIVEDTGVGIPEIVKSKLFTPMMTTKSKGQGLGLAVVKRLVEALNGTISFESEEGKGTKFIIELSIQQ